MSSSLDSDPQLDLIAVDVAGAGACHWIRVPLLALNKEEGKLYNRSTRHIDEILV